MAFYRFLESAWGSIVNAWFTFPDLLFSANPETAMVAWTLLATIAIPVAVFFYNWRDGKRSSALQKQQVKILEEAEKAARESRKAAKSSAEQSFVQGLDRELDLETAKKYFEEIKTWSDGPLKELGLRKIRMQTAVPLPGVNRALELGQELSSTSWNDYRDSFSERIEDNPIRFIKEIKSLFLVSRHLLNGDDYWGVAKQIFSGKLENSYDAEVELCKLFTEIPDIVEPSIEYALNNLSNSSLNEASLVVNVLTFMFDYRETQQKSFDQHRYAISLPLADFLNYRVAYRMEDFSFASMGEEFLFASKIVYLAGQSAKTSPRSDGVDHLKMRMIENVPNLFRKLEIAQECKFNRSDAIDIKDYWRKGSAQLKRDEPKIWVKYQSDIDKIDSVISSL